MRGLALRDRLAASFALALVLAYAVIAVAAMFIVDRAVSRSIDGRLTTVAQAIFTIAGDERDEIDRKDRAQFATIVTDASGALVIGSDGALLLGTTNAVPPWVASTVRAGGIGRIFQTSLDGTPVRAVVEQRRLHHDTNTIVVWQSLRLVKDVEQTVGLVLGGFGLIVALGGFAAGRAIAIRGLLPLTRITAVVADIAAHDLSRRVGPQAQADELGQLAATFDRMLDRLQAAFERQRRFTADASHDLRAPLATLRAEVELALRRERTNDEYRSALTEIAIDADHLDRMIDALLAAARVDAGDVDLAPIELGRVALAGIAAIEPFARAQQVRITSDIAPDIAVLGNADLLERAVLAALHNAVKYTPPGGSIALAVAADAASARLVIRDEGPGFSPAALVHALDRFWRDDSARGRSGTGLGLAIAQGIVQRCGGTIALDNGPAGGAVVTLVFPRLPQPAAPGDTAAGRARRSRVAPATRLD